MALPDGFKLSGGKILDSVGNPVIMIDQSLEAGMALPDGYKLSGGEILDPAGNPVVIAVGSDGSPISGSGGGGGGATVVALPSGDTTGITDTAVIQAAIDAATADPVGGTVELQHGLYWTTGLMMKSRVRLVGQGIGGTRLKMKNSGGAAPVIQVHDDSGVGVEVSYLTIDGNKQHGNTGDGIYFNGTNTLTSGEAASFGTYDPTARFHDLLILWCGGDGYHTVGNGGFSAGQCFLYDSFVLGSDVYGAEIARYDDRMENVEVGCSTQHGVVIGTSAVRLTAVKSWYSGNNRISGDGVGDVISSGSGSYDGFQINGQGCIMVGCFAQDNGRYGLSANSTALKCSGFVAGGNQYGDVGMVDAQSNDIDLMLVNADRASTSASFPLTFDGATTTANHIAFKWEGTAVKSAAVWRQLNSASMSGNHISPFNFEEGCYTLAFASTVTPFPHLGRVQLLALTGPCTVGPCVTGFVGVGQEMTIIFAQDLTGRIVTWDASYVNAPVVSVVANSVTAARFVNRSLTTIPSWVHVS